MAKKGFSLQRKVTCPSCRSTTVVPKQQAGKVVCGACGHVFRAGGS